jgi:hypothetical protein
MADNLTTFMCRLSKNLGASTFCISQGLSSPAMGLLLYYLFRRHFITVWTCSDARNIDMNVCNEYPPRNVILVSKFPIANIITITHARISIV